MRATPVRPARQARHRASRVPRRSGFAIALAVAALGFACTTTGPAPQREPARCVPQFPYQGGWLGGDAAYSIPLDAKPDADPTRRTLWLFGDSFVGGPTSPDRVDATFIHNSIAVSRCGPAGFEIQYAWGEDEAHAPDAYFAHPRADEGESAPYWWLFDGFRLGNAVYVGLLEVTPDAPNGPLALPFRMTGMHLARIANPDAAPSDWRIDVTRLSRGEAGFPGAAMQVDGGFVYFFTFTPLDTGRQRRLLTRLALASIEAFDADLSDEFETWDGASWAPGFLPQGSRVLMDDNATEMSVDYAAARGEWVAVYSAPIQVGEHADPDAAAVSDSVYLRSAPRLEGPWSERRRIYRFPDQRARDASHGLCYAAKNHADFARPGGLFVTYVCNVFAPEGRDPFEALRRLQRRMDLYRPIGVDLQFPDATD